MYVAWWLQLKMIGADRVSSALQVAWPLFFATTTFLVYRLTRDEQALVYTSVGAAIMGMWSTVATSASSTLQRERWMGTLEHLVSTPTPFALVMTPIMTALATTGLYSVGATILWSWLIFDIPLRVARPLAFAVALLIMVISIAMIGFLLSVSAVRYRTAWALGNLFEYPGWLLCGFLVPPATLPGWARALSYALPPTWGMKAIRATVVGSSPWFALGMCAVLTIAFALVATLIAEGVLRSARRHATLPLT